ncbi:tRNA N6-adenosine threonylcarbamoyltransferase OS=Lysinibacillus sphaericus OX=1421 GN=tsaD PE=3 SV=1 [Lysinibacillus sphaericus]
MGEFIMENRVILAIESSCDETAAAIIRNGSEIVSNVVASQIESHKAILRWSLSPEIASNEPSCQIAQLLLVLQRR